MTLKHRQPLTSAICKQPVSDGKWMRTNAIRLTKKYETIKYVCVQPQPNTHEN